jgi:hypothetical protein
MRRFRVTTAALALAAGSLVIAAGPASAAGPNDGGTNCHGVWLSYLATSDMAPGQLHHDYGASVRDVQDTADVMCQL